MVVLRKMFLDERFAVDVRVARAEATIKINCRNTLFYKLVLVTAAKNILFWVGVGRQNKSFRLSGGGRSRP